MSVPKAPCFRLCEKLSQLCGVESQCAVSLNCCNDGKNDTHMSTSADVSPRTSVMDDQDHRRPSDSKQNTPRPTSACSVSRNSLHDQKSDTPRPSSEGHPSSNHASPVTDSLSCQHDRVERPPLDREKTVLRKHAKNQD